MIEDGSSAVALTADVGGGNRRSLTVDALAGNRVLPPRPPLLLARLRGTGEGRCGHLAPLPSVRHRGGVDEEQGIYRGEVRSIMIALADITVDVKTVLGYIEGDDDEEEEEDLPDA